MTNLATTAVLAASLFGFGIQAQAGDSGVTPGAQYQAYRVVLDSGNGYQVVEIEPYESPYFGKVMDNSLLNQIENDCLTDGETQCTVVTLMRLRPSPVNPIVQFPLLDSRSYLWSD